MTDRTAAELEVDAEAARAQVTSTAESIRSKMSPGQLIDEFSGIFTGGDGAATLTNLKGQIRDNPLPLTLIGAGLAWLMLGTGTSSSTRSSNSDAVVGRRSLVGRCPRLCWFFVRPQLAVGQRKRLFGP